MILKQLVIPYLNNNGNIEEVSKSLDAQFKILIDKTNWLEYPYKPKISFAMAYDSHHLFLKYYITEKNACAVTSQINGPVWEDSCCEFFCSFDDSETYYNIETNCIATILAGWHPNKESSVLLPESKIQTIKAVSSLGNSPMSVKGIIKWELTLIIPASVFIGHPKLKFVKGMSFRANFYKCGDKTEIPHFLSWNPIKTLKPDFHQPEYFGKIMINRD